METKYAQVIDARKFRINASGVIVAPRESVETESVDLMLIYVEKILKDLVMSVFQ